MVEDYGFNVKSSIHSAGKPRSSINYGIDYSSYHKVYFTLAQDSIMADLHDVLCRSADVGCQMQDPETGRMPAGHNGPWRNVDTSVRNTAHWTITFFRAFEITGEERYFDGGVACVAFLLSDAVRPGGYTFVHRKDENDGCNGLVGQAWTLEALAYAFEYYEDEHLLETATEVFLLHPFDENLGLWHSVDVDGTDRCIHATFNQQLWFAAIGAQLMDSDERIEARVSRFLDRLEETIRLTDEGLIVHNSYPHQGYPRIRYDVKNVLFSDLKERRRELAVGYHSFNLYGMALLKQAWSDHPFWDSDALKSALQYVESSNFLREARENPYCFGYNPTGFELAFASRTFDDSNINAFEWTERQLALTYDPYDGMMTGGPDPITLSARIYEAVRLPNVELDDVLYLGGRDDQ